MCVISLVMDHFNPLIPQVPPATEFKTITVNGPAPVDLEELKRIIADFKQAVEAAKKVDALTGQADCLDPEKAKLEERVELLEWQIAALKTGKPVRRKRK